MSGEIVYHKLGLDHPLVRELEYYSRIGLTEEELEERRLIEEEIQEELERLKESK